MNEKHVDRLENLIQTVAWQLAWGAIACESVGKILADLHVDTVDKKLT